MHKGFERFCDQYAFNRKVVNNIADEPILRGEVYINLMENDLVTLIERIIAGKLQVGKDVGVISYNESTAKEDHSRRHHHHIDRLRNDGKESSQSYFGKDNRTY